MSIFQELISLCTLFAEEPKKTTTLSESICGCGAKTDFLAFFKNY